MAFAALACGPGPNSSRTGSTPLDSPVNRTTEARPGGTLRSFLASEPSGFDPIASSGAVQTHFGALTYPRLLKYTTALHPQHATGTVEGDLAESFEFSADRLQLVLRLRQGLRWDQRPPTAGRTIDAQDVLFSWNKFARLNAQRHELVYNAELGPASPVESVAAPDARTLVFRLRQPDSSLAGMLASERHFYVMPRESDGGFDPKLEARGYGPWLLLEHRPAVQRTWGKNPDYHVRGRPFPDRLEQAVVTDYAARLAQFKAGLIYTSVVSQSDILQTRHELPGLLFMKQDAFSTSPGWLGFGYDGESPWRDERLRQAVSLLLDRETLINVRSNRARFEAQGIPFEVRYHTAIAAGWHGYWTDPKSDAFGPSGRFFRFEPQEARRLMLAAGYADGLDTLLHYNGGSEYQPGYTRTVEMLAGMLYEGGIRARLDPREYASDWLPNYHLGYASTGFPGRQAKGFAGLIYRFDSGSATPALQAFATMHRLGSRFQGMTPDGRNAQQGDPEVNRLIEAMRREFDQRLEQGLALELARLIARRAYAIPMLPYAAQSYSLTWPVVANLGVYNGWPSGSPHVEANLHLWLDVTKPPLGERTTS